jgi:hypothetical protein
MMKVDSLAMATDTYVAACEPALPRCGLPAACMRVQSGMLVETDLENAPKGTPD